MILIFLLTILLVPSNPTPLEDTSAKGTFWQFTDIHWDLRYTENGDPTAMCHSNNTTGENHNGYFGNYFCDSPWNLVQSAMVAMEHLQATPDFILWTGDNAPHTTDPMPDFNVIFKTVSNLTKELRTRFAGIQIIPVLGNHDVYPKDYFPADNTTFYEKYLASTGWDTILSKEAQKEFSNGGYFVARVSPQLSVLSLNTNLYYRYNTLGMNSTDPAGQFKWIKSKLEEARDNQEKVIIAAHAPPGYFERNGIEPFFNETYNKNYTNLLSNYGDVIVAQIYGHEHTDTFRLFNSHEGTESVAFLAPSLTPWYPSEITGGTAINPSVRLYSYDSSDILDYHQYHLNLTEANNDQTITSLCTFGPTYNRSECEQQLPNLWTLYYQATVTFSSPSLDVTAMTSFLGQLHTNDTLLQTYYRINSAGVEHPHCNATCRRVFLCAIDHLLAVDFTQCRSIPQVIPIPEVPSHTDQCDDPDCPYSVDKALVTELVLAAIAVSVLLVLLVGVALWIRSKSVARSVPNARKARWFNKREGYTVFPE